MKKVAILFVLLCSLKSFSQIAYYDALKLRTDVVWKYTWKITYADNKPGVPTMAFKTNSPYPTGFNKADTIIGGRTIHFTSYSTPVIFFNATQNVKLILRDYSNHKSDTNFLNIQSDYESNIFMYPYISNSDGFTAGGATVNGSSSKSILSSIGGLDVTNISKGLSLFLIDRAKKELDLAFFQRLKRYFDKNEEIKTLFPNTTDVMVRLLEYQYTEMLPVLQESFNTDLKNLPENMIQVFSLDKYSSLITEFPEITLIINSYNLIKQIGTLNPPQIIEKLPDITKNMPKISDTTKKRQIENLHSALELTKIFSNSIRTKDKPVIDKKIVTSSTSTESLKKFIKRDANTITNFTKITKGDTIIEKHVVTTVNDSTIIIKDTVTKTFKDSSNAITTYWISASEFQKNILSDSIALNIYLGLLYQQIKNDTIKFNNSLLYEKLLKNSKDILWFKMQFSKLLDYTEKLDNTVKEIKKLKAENKKPTEQDIYNYVNLTLDIGDFGYSVIKKFIPNDNKIDKGELYIKLVREVNEVYINTFSEKYAIAINHAINIYKTISELKIPDTINKKKCSCKKNLLNPGLINKISIVATFIANVADAKSPEEVKSAIEAAALPVGSSSFKKYNQWNFAINGYLGGNYNFEIHKSPNSAWQRHFNVTAPVGLNLSFASLGKCGAFSAFVPLIDVGAIVNSQLSKDQTTIDQKIYLRNIFSPGGYIVYGFGANLPLSIGVGGQYGPGLYKMGTDPLNPSWRFNAFLAVDIPMFNIIKGTKIHDPKVKSKKKK